LRVHAACVPVAHAQAQQPLHTPGPAPESKRGNRYLRVLFVQAAWVVLIKPTSWERHGLKHWIEAARKRLHRNVLAIALANKLARIAWGVLAGGRTFEASKLQTA
jgi:transposase